MKILTPCDLQDLTVKQRNSHSTGVEYISNTLLRKRNADFVFLLNLILSNGVLPDKLKLACVVPDFKTSQQKNFIEKFSYLSCNQHHFTKNLNMETTLCNYVLPAIDVIAKEMLTSVLSFRSFD